jgi:Fe-S cluster assembly scaffold protein SufB
MIYIITAEPYIQTYYIAHNTHAQYVFICKTDKQQHYIDLHFIVERNASVHVELCSIAGDVLVNILCILQGEHARADIRAGHVVRGNNKVQITAQQRHEAPHTESSLLVHSVVDDQAQVSYTGTIFIEEDAHLSVSSQHNKNIILSNEARVVSVPNLEVIPHDVQCFLGISIG